MDFEEKLIEEVRQNSVLYNLADRNYRNVIHKEHIWGEIANVLDSDGPTCRKKWKGLRDTYKRQKREENLRSGSGAPEPKKKWRYFDLLTFLDNYKDSGPTIGNIQKTVESVIDVEEYSFSEVVPTPSTSKQRKRRGSDAAEKSFTAFMSKCSESIAELAAEAPKSSTALLFEALAKKIESSNLSDSDINNIESKVMNLVYGEIALLKQ